MGWITRWGEVYKDHLTELKKKMKGTDSLQRWGLWLGGEFYPQFKVSSSLFCPTPTPTPTQHSALSNFSNLISYNQNLYL